jgi:hypothetical protein
MRLKGFSLPGIITRFRNAVEGLPNVYDGVTGKIYTGKLSTEDRAELRLKTADRSVYDNKHVVVEFTGAGRKFTDISVFQLNGKRRANDFIPVQIRATGVDII